MELIGPPAVYDVESLYKFAEAFEPRPKQRFARWCVDHITNDEGRVYDHANYPHLAAPGGPADAIDYTLCRTIACQFGTRLGKTFAGLCMLLYFAERSPAQEILASESQQTAEQLMGRLYKMIYHSRRFTDLLRKKSEKEQSIKMVRFRECELKASWARSVGTLADFNATYGLANELDKGGWIGTSTTKEGAPIKLLEERFKDNQSIRKVYMECTPTVFGSSEIERRRLAGWNCRFMVPCPHCGTYQTLQLSPKDENGEYDYKQPGGVRWEGGLEATRDQIRATAHYVCCTGNCKKITDFDRHWMIRRGVWVPEGCEIVPEEALKAAEQWYEDLSSVEYDPELIRFTGWDDASWVTGTPRNSSENASFGPLSSLYALALSWSDYAIEFVSSYARTGDLRNWVNSWAAETWVASDKTVTEWEVLGEKLIDKEIERGVVPPWVSKITVGIDRQISEGGYYPWIMIGWGPHFTHHVIDYGTSDILQWIQTEILSKEHQYADGGKIQPNLAFIDFGGSNDGTVEEWCVECLGKHKVQVWPCKGSAHQMNSEYRQSKFEKNTRFANMTFFMVDTYRTQYWIDKRLHTLQREDPGSATIFNDDIYAHQDFLEQILNEHNQRGLDRKNYDKREWTRIDATIPNDFRDCWRYAFAAILRVMKGKPIPSRYE